MALIGRNLLLSGLLLAAVGACDRAPPADTEKAEDPQAALRIGEIDRSKAGTPAPDVTMERQGGGPASLTSFRGTPVLVNLWATWCAPCVAEMPALDRLAEAKGYDLPVVAVSQDMQGWQAVEPFLEKAGIEHMTVLLDQRGTLAAAVGARGLPVTILYDASGKEVWRVNGPREWDQPGGLPDMPAAEAEKAAP